jgi:hypothetical protein
MLTLTILPLSSALHKIITNLHRTRAGHLFPIVQLLVTVLAQCFRVAVSGFSNSTTLVLLDFDTLCQVHMKLPGLRYGVIF